MYLVPGVRYFQVYMCLLLSGDLQVAQCKQVTLQASMCSCTSLRDNKCLQSNSKVNETTANYSVTVTAKLHLLRLSG